jgi:hypothetical protein
MGNTSISNLPYKESVAERIGRTYLNSSPEKQAQYTDVEHQISAMMLRCEQLLSIVASCECCSGKYRQKIGESSRTNRMTGLVTTMHIKTQILKDYDLSTSTPITGSKTQTKSQYNGILF